MLHAFLVCALLEQRSVAQEEMWVYLVLVCIRSKTLVFPFSFRSACVRLCEFLWGEREAEQQQQRAHIKRKKNKKQQNFFRHGVESNSKKKKKNDQAYLELLITTETCLTLLVLSFLFCFVFRWFVISCWFAPASWLKGVPTVSSSFVLYRCWTLLYCPRGGTTKHG